MIWNSLRNKYVERSEDFTLPQAKMFFKNYEAFSAFCVVILGMSIISFYKSMQWVNKITKI